MRASSGGGGGGEDGEDGEDVSDDDGAACTGTGAATTDESDGPTATSSSLSTGTSHRLHDLRHALRAIGAYSHRSSVTSAQPSTGKSGSATPSPSMSQPYAPSSTHASVPLPPLPPLPPSPPLPPTSASNGRGDGDGDASGSSASGTAIEPGSGSSIVASSRSSDETSPSPCTYERCSANAARPAARTAATRDARAVPSSRAIRLCSHGVSVGGCAHRTSPANSATSSQRTEPLKGRLGATCGSAPITIGTQPAASES